MISNVLVGLLLVAVVVLLVIVGWKMTKSFAGQMDPWQLIPVVAQPPTPTAMLAGQDISPMSPTASKGKALGFYPAKASLAPVLSCSRQRPTILRANQQQAKPLQRQPRFIGGTTGYKADAPCWICGRPRSECKKH